MPIHRFSLQAISRSALFCALLCICAQITIPLTIPITLQTLALMLCAALLTPGQNAASVGSYLLLGAIGLPVFSAFRGGIAALVGATGGYLWGMLPGTVIAALFLRRFGREHWKLPIAFLLCLLTCYTLGTAWYALFYAAGTPLLAVLSTCVFPFLLPDFFKILLALFLARRLERLITIEATTSPVKNGQKIR